MQGDVGWVQQQILVSLTVREDRVPIKEAKEIKLAKVANNVDGTVRRDSTFVNLMKKTLNFSISFETEHNKKFVATHIVDIVKDIMRSEFLTVMSAQSYFQYLRFAEMFFRHGSVLIL